MLNVPLRLRTVMDSLGDWQGLADIGTDHALLPISLALVHKGARGAIIGIDNKEGPLKAAHKGVLESGVQEFVELRKGSGLGPLKPGEVDTVTICGMGHGTIWDIICEGNGRPDGVLRGVKRLVLQANGFDGFLRRHLIRDLGWDIPYEYILRETGHHYVIDVVTPGNVASGLGMPVREIIDNLVVYGLDIRLILAFGPRLIWDREPLLEGVLQGEELRVGQALEKARVSMGERALSAQSDMEDELRGLRGLREWLSAFKG